MEVSKAQVQEILKTLPIGYYAGRNIELTLGDSQSSNYDPINDKIEISYTNIKMIMDKIDSTETLEKDIRCLLYHELSHAILTHKDIIIYAAKNYGGKYKDIINVFEDERIETLLKDYYINVDFKSFVIKLNDYHGEEGTTDFERFYNLVRFRQGPKEFLDRVNNIIVDYSDITNYQDTYFSLSNSVFHYIEDVIRLYIEFCEDSLKDTSKSTKNNTSSKEKSSEKEKSYESDSNKEKSSKKEKSSEKENFSKSDSNKETYDEEKNDLDDTQQELLKNIEKAMSSISKESIQSIVSKSFDNYYSNELNEKLKQILSQNFKMSKHNGSSISSYSGVFNPRLTTRDDYKYFAQKNRLGNIKSFSKIHLNLFIDCSGSFASSDMSINKLLNSLIKLEKTYSDFTFDLIHCGMGFKIAEKNKRIQESRGGNKVTKELIQIYNSLQHTNSINYNIVCFDGDAFTDNYDTNVAVKYFLAFNRPNVVIISDKSNQYAFDNYAKSAKRIYCNNYAEELINNTISALAYLFK